MKASTSTCRNWLVKGVVGGGGGCRNWMSPRMQMCQSAQAMPGFGWAMEPGPGLIYSKRYKEFTSQGKILFRLYFFFYFLSALFLTSFFFFLLFLSASFH